MTKFDYAKMFGFKSNEAYPVLFKTLQDGKNVPYKPEHGTFVLPFDKDSDRVRRLNFGTYRIVRGYVPMSAFTQENLIPNDANPRNGIYDAKRAETVETVCCNPLTLPGTFGCSVIASEVDCKDGKIIFSTKEEYKANGTNETRKTGCFNGQNLMYILATINEKIRSGEVEYAFDTNEIEIPFEFYVFSDEVKWSDVLAFCKIKNFTVAQTSTAIATMNGDFNPYLFKSIADGIEVRFGDAKMDVEYVKLAEDIIAGKHDEDEENLTRCVGSKVDIASYVKMAAMVYSSMQKNKYYKNEVARLKNWKDYGLEKNEAKQEKKEVGRKSVSGIIAYGRRKMTAVKEILKAQKDNSVPVFHSVLNEPLMNKFFFDAYDYVLSYDYSDYFAENKDAYSTLCFSTYKNATLSPFTRSNMKYSLPLGITTLIPFLFGCFCDVKKDKEERETVVCNVDFKKFWDKNASSILDKIVKYKETNEGKAEYSMYDARLDGCVNLWVELRDLCNKSKSKYTIKK